VEKEGGGGLRSATGGSMQRPKTSGRGRRRPACGVGGVKQRKWVLTGGPHGYSGGGLNQFK
jgi:hypothetical protein